MHLNKFNIFSFFMFRSMLTNVFNVRSSGFFVVGTYKYYTFIAILFKSKVSKAICLNRMDTKHCRIDIHMYNYHKLSFKVRKKMKLF